MPHQFEELPERRADERAAEMPQPSRPPLHTPAAILALQRSAGNHAVARMLQGPQLQRRPISDADPASETFWKDLAFVAETKLIRFLGAFSEGIDQFESDLTLSEPAEGAGEFLVDTFITLIAFLPEKGEIAVGVLSVLKGLYEQIENETLDLRAFLDQARGNKDRVSGLVDEQSMSLGIFEAIAGAQAREEAGLADVSRRGEVAAELADVVAKLPTWKQIRAALTVDWINSSIDGWDPDQQAGCIVLGVRFGSEPPLEDPPAHSWTRPYLEDVSRPDGVRESLKATYGEGRQLELLPIEMIANVMMGGLNATLRNPREKVFPTRSKPSWQFVSGSPEVHRAWLETRIYPTVGDLV